MSLLFTSAKDPQFSLVKKKFDVGLWRRVPRSSRATCRQYRRSLSYFSPRISLERAQFTSSVVCSLN